MPARTVQTWIARRIAICHRLERVCTSSLLLLMVVRTKHALEEAARFSGLHQSQCCKMWPSHAKVAISTVERLSKPHAKQLAKALHPLQGLPWKIALIVDSTLQRRASLHPENAKRFNHGNGFVIGQQWTNSVLIINDMVIPLRPIPCYRQPYGREHACDEPTEHDLVVDSLGQWNLEDSIGSHDSRDVIVLADRGEENKKIAQAIVHTRWHFLSALGKTRSVTSAGLSLTTPKSRQWCPMSPCLRNHRRVKWHTIRVTTHGAKHKRMVCRIRDTMGYLRYVGQVPFVCSERRHRPEGRRKYLAWSDMRGTARQIIIGYRLRWAMELFHKNVKQHLGFEEVATSGCDAVMSQVYWGYCAYRVLHMSPPRVSPEAKSLGDTPRQLQQALAHKEQRRILQKLTQIGGVQRSKDALRQALADA